jgi:hypothetical protein
LQKDTCGYAKVLKKKRRKKYEKNRQVFKRINNGYSDARLKRRKKEMNKIAHVFFAKYYSIIKRGIFSRSSSRIRISHHIHLSHIHYIPYTCIF